MRFGRSPSSSSALKWLGFVTAVWVQAISGNNYTFSNYSDALKSLMNLTQLELNSLSVAKDVGKAFGILAGLASDRLSTPVILLIGCFEGLIGYGVQWLVVSRTIQPLPYWQMCIFLCMGGNSTTWMNTAVLVTCIRNFRRNRGPVSGILKGYVGLSTAIFTDVCTALFSADPASFLVLLSVVPFAVCLTAVLFLREIPPAASAAEENEESRYFAVFNIVAVVVAVYLQSYDIIGVKTGAISIAFASVLLVLLASPIAIPFHAYVRSLNHEEDAEEPLLRSEIAEETVVVGAAAAADNELPPSPKLLKEKEKAAMEEPQRKIWRKIWRRIRTKREKEKTAMEEPERKNRRRIKRKMEGPEWNIPREKASLDDDELWAGFKWEETDKILSGEIQPRTLITTYMSPCSSTYPERGPFIAREMASVFPNSKYVIRGPNVMLDAIIALARKNGCTSLILARTDPTGEDTISIVNFLNNATATFRVIDLIPREDIPNRSDPITGLYPRIQMRGFESPASVGTAKMIQALFPYVPPVRGRRSIAWFEKQNNYIFFRHSGYFQKETVEGQPPPSVRSLIKECGPRFALQFTGLQIFDDHNVDFHSICMPDITWTRRCKPLPLR